MCRLFITTWCCGVVWRFKQKKEQCATVLFFSHSRWLWVFALSMFHQIHSLNILDWAPPRTWAFFLYFLSFFFYPILEGNILIHAGGSPWDISLTFLWGVQCMYFLLLLLHMSFFFALFLGAPPPSPPIFFPSLCVCKTKKSRALPPPMVKSPQIPPQNSGTFTNISQFAHHILTSRIIKANNNDKKQMKTPSLSKFEKKKDNKKKANVTPATHCVSDKILSQFITKWTHITYSSANAILYCIIFSFCPLPHFSPLPQNSLQYPQIFFPLLPLIETTSKYPDQFTTQSISRVLLAFFPFPPQKKGFHSKKKRADCPTKFHFLYNNRLCALHLPISSCASHTSPHSLRCVIPLRSRYL